MLLIYSHISTIRLQYICKFIFDEILGTSYSITTHEQSFLQHDGNKLNYSLTNFENTFQIKPVNLLFEDDVKQQEISCFNYNNEPAFFKTNSQHFPFDIFAATFYLITRYEEYLPHTKDMYGRYAHENSAAFKNNFLQNPLINIWLQNFKSVLQNYFPDLKFAVKKFSYTATYDIDIAWAYKQKGFLRNIGGFLKKPSINRLTTLAGLNEDPFDCYDFLHDLHQKNKIKSIYFFLVAQQNGIYDKNILPDNVALQNLIKEHTKKYEIGLHPSWQSYNENTVLINEKNILEEIAQTPINISRQHYIKFDLPNTFQNLIAAKITDDYSMGYGSINGFRASVASSFYWFDLSKNIITKLRIHPFCFMDANSYYEQKQAADETLVEINNYLQAVKNVNGNFITIFHNSILGTDKSFAGWSNMYNNFIKNVTEIIT
jgi:hypothetical protein